MEKYLYEKLINYGVQEVYPFHMPGHKRNISYVGKLLPYEMDITEINEFDDLHHPEGIIMDMEERASKIFKSEITHCLVNGSTVGNIAAIMGCTEYGDKILIARNCHISVHTAVNLNKLEPVYVFPNSLEDYGICGEIYAENVEAAIIKDRNIKAVIIVSPTYEGVISDIEKIANVTHKYGIPLIVDEAHGAHLGLNPYFHKNSNELGADIVVHSIHKTLPALTQTALIHINGELVDRKKVKKYLRMLQSSSPSYILMAGISRCLELLEENIEDRMKYYIENLEFLRMKLKTMRCLTLIETQCYDKGKIVISTDNSNITSSELFSILRERYGLELEMDGVSYVIAMTTLADTMDGLSRLENALIEIDEELKNNTIAYDHNSDIHGSKDVYMEQKEFHESMQKKLRLSHNFTDKKTVAELFVEEGLNGDDKGEESEHSYYLYPPGIPLILPGELITEKHKILMNAYKKRGYTIRKS